MRDRSQQTWYWLELLRTIAEHLNHTLELKPMLSAALTLVLDLMDLQTGWVLLLDKEERFYCVVTHGLPSSLTTDDWAALCQSHCRCQRMFMAGEFAGAVHIVECERLERAWQALEGPEPPGEYPEIDDLRYHISIPLQAGNQVLGLMNLAQTHDEPLNEETVTLFSLMGEALGAAIQQAQFHNQLVQETEARYRALFDGVPVGLYRSTPEGQILDANSALIHMLGYPDRETFLETNAADLYVNAEDRRQWQVLIEQEEAVRDFEMQVYRHDGTVIWVRDNARVIRNGEHQVLYYEGSLENITAYKQAKEALERRTEALTALHATILDIAAPNDLPTLLRTIVERATELLEGAGGGLYLCDPDEQKVRCEVSYKTPRDYAGTVLEYGEGAAGTVAQTGKPLRIDDYRVWPDRAAVFEEISPATAMLNAPMIWQDQVIGVIQVMRNGQVNPGHFTEVDLELLALFANQAAIAVENSRLFAETTQALARQQHFNKVARTISGELELSTILQNVVSLAVEAVEGEAGALALQLDDGENITYPYLCNLPTELSQQIAQKGQGLAWQIVGSGMSMLMADYSAHPNAMPSLVEAGVHGALYVPVVAGNTRLGALGVFGLTPEKQFTVPDVRLAEAIGRQAGVAIQNARLYEEVQRLAGTDELTGLHNRRYFFELAEHEFDRAQRYARPLSAIMIDIDHFKQVNDTYGHAVGDQVLRAVAERCRCNLREVDVLGRYGGEEFVVLLPETELEAARQAAERLRRQVGQTSISTDQAPVTITLSLGVATLGAECADLAGLLECADQMLYAAKQAGRNRVYVWQG